MVNTRKDILLDSPAVAENPQSSEFNPCTSRKQKARVGMISEGGQSSPSTAAVGWTAEVTLKWWISDRTWDCMGPCALGF